MLGGRKIDYSAGRSAENIINFVKDELQKVNCDIMKAGISLTDAAPVEEAKEEVAPAAEEAAEAQ
jgi:hypothetical protein